MKIVIPDDYQDMVDKLDCYALIRHHDVVRYREPARDLDQLVARLADADIVVSIRERVEFSLELLGRLPRLKFIGTAPLAEFTLRENVKFPFLSGKSVAVCAEPSGPTYSVSCSLPGAPPATLTDRAPSRAPP